MNTLITEFSKLANLHRVYFPLGNTLNTTVTHQLPTDLSISNSIILSVEVEVTSGERYDYYPNGTFHANELTVSLRSTGLITSISSTDFQNRTIRVVFWKFQ